MKKIVMSLALLTISLAVLGADVDFYGKINLGVWYQKNERFYDDSVMVNDTTFKLAGDSMPIVISNWLPHGTFGVRYKAGRFGGCIEMGTHYSVFDSKFYGSATNARIIRKVGDFITMKKWFAEWYINDYFTFLFGKEYVPTNFFPSNQMFFGGQYRFNNVGCLSTGAYPMFQLKVKSSNGNLEGKVAVIKPDTTVIHIRKDISIVDHQVSAKLPKFEGGFRYFFTKDIFSTYGNFAGGYQVYEVVQFEKDPNLAKDSLYLNVPSFVLGADLGVKIGPVSLAADVFYGQNIGVYGVFVGDRYKWWRLTEYMKYYYPEHGSEIIDSTTGDLEWKLYNSTALGAAFILRINATDFLAFEGGLGMIFGTHELEEYDERFHNTLAWYFQTELKILEMLKVMPEVGQYDYGPLSGFGRYLYWGLNTGIEF